MQRERGIHQNGWHMQEKALPTSHLMPALKQVVDTGSAAQVCGSSLREEASLSGQQRGRYTLIRKIGQGGYASIYLGVHHYSTPMWHSNS
jgi:hypothetical protein